MPAPVDARTKQQFLTFLKDGFSLSEAARQANVSYSWAKKYTKGIDNSGEGWRSLRETKDLPEPIEYVDLIPEAQRAWHDIAYFARRYFGAVAMPWQVMSTNQTLPLLESDQKEYVVLNCPPGAGKALALDTPIPTPSGWSTMKDIAVGDWVFDDQGKPCQVTYKSPVFYDRDCYEVSTDDGASVIADGEHLWQVRMEGAVGRGYTLRPGPTGPKPKGVDGWTVRTTEYLATTRAKRPQLPVTAPLDLPTLDLPIEPYVLGMWLGDGHSDGARITCHDDDAPFTRAEIERRGYVTHDVKSHQQFQISGAEGVRWSRGNLVGQLRAANLLRNKHIPEMYFRAARHQRLALLQGLIDSDGYVAPNGMVEFCNTNRDLAEGVLSLARSLGVKAGIHESRAVLRGVDCGPRWRVTFYMAEAALLPRKAARCKDGVRTPHRYLTVTHADSVPTQCIQVDSPSHLYLAGEGFMVTHNTTYFTLIENAWLTVRNRAIRGMIVSNTQRNANNYLVNLRRALDQPMPIKASDNDLKLGIAVDAEASLVMDYGLFRQPGESGDRWTQTAFQVMQHKGRPVSEKESTWQAFGKGGAFLGNRLDRIVCDDVYDRSMVKTSEAREDFMLWYDKHVETRLEPNGMLLLVGQRQDADDVYRHCLNKVVLIDEDGDDIESEADATKKYHHIKFQAHYDELCNDQHKDVKPYPEGCLLYPGRIKWRDIRSLTPDVLAVEYQQEDVAPGATLVDPLWVSGGKDPKTGIEYFGCLDKDRGEWQLPEGLTGNRLTVAALDPSPSNFWSVQAWTFHPESDRRFLLAHVRKKMQTPALLNHDVDSGVYAGIMEDWQNRSEAEGNKITHWIVEDNAAQKFMLQADFAVKWAQRRGVLIVRHNTNWANKGDSNLGIQALAPKWMHGKVRLPYSQVGDGRLGSLALINEVTKWPEGRTDDAVMAHWFAEWNYPRLYAPRLAEPYKFARPSWLRAVSA